MLIFFVYIIGLLGTVLLSVVGLAWIAVGLIGRRLRPLRVPVGTLCGYFAGVLLVWSLVPREWALPFRETLAATVNAEKYGHPVEHAAEGIVVWMLFAGVAGAAIGAAAAHIAGKPRRKRAPAPPPALFIS